MDLAITSHSSGSEAIRDARIGDYYHRLHDVYTGIIPVVDSTDFDPFSDFEVPDDYVGLCPVYPVQVHPPLDHDLPQHDELNFIVDAVTDLVGYSELLSSECANGGFISEDESDFVDIIHDADLSVSASMADYFACIGNFVDDGVSVECRMLPYRYYATRGVMFNGELFKIPFCSPVSRQSVHARAYRSYRPPGECIKRLLTAITSRSRLDLHSVPVQYSDGFWLRCAALTREFCGNWRYGLSKFLEFYRSNYVGSVVYRPNLDGNSGILPIPGSGRFQFYSIIHPTKNPFRLLDLDDDSFHRIAIENVCFNSSYRSGDYFNRFVPPGIADEVLADLRTLYAFNGD